MIFKVYDGYGSDAILVDAFTLEVDARTYCDARNFHTDDSQLNYKCFIGKFAAIHYQYSVDTGWRTYRMSIFEQAGLTVTA